jgi:hypothetical protein
MRHGQAVREGKQLETPASGPPQRLRARAADARKGADPSGREPTSVATAAPTEQTLVQHSVALDPGYAVCRAFRNHYGPAVYTTIPAAAFLGVAVGIGGLGHSLSAIDSIRQSGSRLMRSFDSMICASIAE